MVHRMRFTTTQQLLYFSTHRYPFYPGSGRKEEDGQGKGKGFTVNVPSADTMPERYVKIFTDVMEQGVNQFVPGAYYYFCRL